MNINIKDSLYFLLSIIFICFVSYIIYSFTIQLIRSIKNKKSEISKSIYFVVFSIFELLILELIQENSSFYFQSIIVTFCFLYFLNYFLGYLKKYKLYISLIFLVFFIYGIIQRFVIIFKGIPFTLGDISAVGTALEVFGKYKFNFTLSMYISLIFMIILDILLFKVSFVEKTKNKKTNIILFLIYIIFVCFMTFNSALLNFCFNVTYWNPLLCYHQNGTLGHIYVDIVNSKFKYPTDYNEENLEKTLENIEVNYTENFSKERAVNIICILEESLYDLNIIEDLDLNDNNLSYYNLLEENTIKGNTIVSGFGGGTANSEWEFLTNSNMFFMPKGTYPFTRYIKNNNFSLASVLKDLDFKTISFHPFSKNTWNRPFVYSALGFDEYYALEDLPQLENEKNLLRGTVSDSANMQQIIDFYENKKEGENLFIYNVTIQNHAGYGEDFGLNDIYSNRYKSQSLSTYLTLIDKTDDSIKELIEYFDKVDEPTLICIFGDHYPGTFDNNDVVDKVLRGPDYISGDDKLLRYTTPFLIHTNYDIEETNYYDGISLSYLSTLVMDYANLPKSKEQAFVQSFMNKYPIINEWGYKTNGEWFDRADITEDLKLWRDLTYYNLNYK